MLKASLALRRLQRTGPKVAMRPQEASVAVPTWQGFIETTRDALHIFEAYLNGTLPFCSGRPLDRSVIVSGNVFVYTEAISGIRRWTDGIGWSPSRMLTNFLIYRQLDDDVARGDRRKTGKHSQGALEPGVSRCLVGSLTDSYKFKNEGLLKKAITITLDDLPYRLIAYYSMNDAEYLKRPRDDSRLQDLQIRDTLLKQAKFTSASIDDTGDKELDQANRTSKYGFDDYQYGYNPRSLHPTLIYDVQHVQSLQPGSSQDVALAYLPPSCDNSAPMYPYNTGHHHHHRQQLCVCAYHSQAQTYPQQWDHQAPQIGFNEHGLF